MRFQELMPDVLHWLGVRRIHPARVDEQHEVRRDRQGRHRGRRARADSRRARAADAQVEMDAKMAAGYFTEGDKPDADATQDDEGSRLCVASGSGARGPAPWARPRGRRAESASGITHCTLRDPVTIRERAANMLAGADAGRTRHFSVDRDAARRVRRLVRDVTRRRYPTLAIPYHSRWRHFEAAASTAAPSSTARCPVAARPTRRSRASTSRS
jgi:hypothetical protein